MKPKYEKLVAVPLGETVKGSGECNAGSGVMPGAYNCKSGSTAGMMCLMGGSGAIE